MIRQDIPKLLKHIEAHKPYIGEVHKTIDIFHGNLRSHVLNVLYETLDARSYEAAKDRVASINTLQKLIEKLSRIYQHEPTREVENGTEADSELLSEYEYHFKINETMNGANEMFNLNKTCLLEPFVDEKTRKPKLKVIENDKFLVYSDDMQDPTRITHVIIFEGKQEVMTDKGMTEKAVFRAFTDDEFLLFDQDGNILQDRMNAMGNPEGINPYGRIPFVYINRSQYELIPTLDSDVCSMTILISLLLSDLGYAIKYMAFSLVYGIDVDMTNVTRAPNAFLELKSDIEGNKPELGTIKPEVDIDQVMQYTMDLFSLWMNTKGLKAGAVGANENNASGFAKMIDQMDASEARTVQVEIFKNSEERDLWELVFNYLHPYWVATGMIDLSAQFSANAYVSVHFHDQKPMFNRGQLVEELKAEVEAGFLTKKMAIKRLNPRMSQSEIDELVAEIEGEKAITIPLFGGQENDNQQEDDIEQ
jgi:hypothetical protein